MTLTYSATIGYISGKPERRFESAGSHYRRSLTLWVKIHRQEQKGDVIAMGWMRWLASAVGLPTADLAA